MSRYTEEGEMRNNGPQVAPDFLLLHNTTPCILCCYRRFQTILKGIGNNNNNKQ